jgi:hypothetical protein
MPYSYNELISAIQANMEEDSVEFLTELPKIIERAQSHLQRRLDPININRFTEVSVSASVRTLNLPGRNGLAPWRHHTWQLTPLTWTIT